MKRTMDFIVASDGDQSVGIGPRSADVSITVDDLDTQDEALFQELARRHLQGLYVELFDDAKVTVFTKSELDEMSQQGEGA